MLNKTENPPNLFRYYSRRSHGMDNHWKEYGTDGSNADIDPLLVPLLGLMAPVFGDGMFFVDLW